MSARRHQFAIDLPVRNEWANVDLLRTSILNCFTAVFNDVDGCRQLAMVVGELLENAIKYGAWTGADSAFRLQVVGEANHARISVENPIDPNDTALGDLMETLTWLRRFPSAEEAYRARLLEVAALPRELEASGLGLARISYEGSCKLSAVVEGRTVRVTAEMNY